MSEQNLPLYQQIYNYVVDEIKSEKFKSGDRIPSEKELAEEFKVSRITSKKALEMLMKNGLITRMPGRGSYVMEDAGRIANSLHEVEQTIKKKETLFGIILPDFSESYGMTLLSGIERQASEENCFVVIKRSYGQQDIEEAVIDSLLDLGVDGIIVMPVHGEHYNPKILRLILDGFPVVSVDRCLSGIPVSFVGTDNLNASKKAIDYLLELGHTSIAVLSPPMQNTSALEDRVEGFVKSHVEHGVAVDENIWLTNLVSTMPGQNTKESIDDDIEKIMKLIQNNTEITCLYVVEYNIALLAMKAVKALGKAIPEDISILCFDSPFNYAGEYLFTFVRQREAEMGATAVKLLIKQMMEKGVNDKVYLDSDLVIGTTTLKRKD